MSNGRVAEYIVRLVGQNAQLIGQVNQATTGLQQMTNQASAASKANSSLTNTLKGFAAQAAAAFSVVAIEQFLSASVSAYEESAKAQAKVAQAIKTTGGVAGHSLQELTDIAADFQKSTLFEDDSIMNNVTAQLLTFTNIAGVNFKRAQVAALDLATVLDGDLKGTAIQLGKALNDPVAGLAALGRSGVSFSAEQKAVIKDLADTNQLAAAQTLILDELNRQYGGQAVAAAKASTGITQMKNSVGDLMEVIGGAIVDSSFFKSVIKDISDTANALSSPQYNGWEKLAAILWGVDDATIEIKKYQAEQAKAQINEMASQTPAYYTEMALKAKAAADVLKEADRAKMKTLKGVTEALAAEVEAQSELNSEDTKSVAASKAKILTLTTQKEALEKLYAVQKPRTDKAIAPMEQRLNVTPVVSGKKDLQAPGLRIKAPVTYESDTMKDYSKELDVITQKSILYGNVLGTVNAKKEATKAAIDGLLNEGYAAESLEVQRLMGIMDQYNEQQAQIQGISEKTKEALSQMGGAFSTLGSAIGGTAGSWIGFAGTLLEQIPTLITQIVALTSAQVAGSTATVAAKTAETAATNLSTASTVVSATVSATAGATEVATSGAITAAKTTETYVSGAASAAKMPFPANLIAMALVIGTIGAIIASIPKAKKFASGGIISGPTLGLMGEYPGASNNPEVVAPLSKLKGMINDRSGAMDISVQDIVLTGSQLRIIQKVTDRQLTKRS